MLFETLHKSHDDFLNTPNLLESQVASAVDYEISYILAWQMLINKTHGLNKLDGVSKTKSKCKRNLCRAPDYLR